MAVVFNYGGTFPATVVTFTRDPQMGGFATTKQWMNPIVRSESNDAYVYPKDVTSKIVTLTWGAIDQTDLINLLSFIDTIDGTANRFHFTDPESNPFTAYLIDTERYAWTPVELMEYEFSIKLLVTDSVAIDYLVQEGLDEFGAYSQLLTENSHSFTEEY